MAQWRINGKCCWKMYSAAFIVNLLYVSAGCFMVWPSPAIPMLKQLGYTDEQNSWITSIMALGAAVGSLTIGLPLSSLSRKNFLYLNGGLFVVSWMIMYFPKYMVLLCVGRFFGGYATSMTFNIVPVYLTEISQDEVRQAMTSPMELFIGLGFLLECLFGSLFNYYRLLIASLMMVVIFLVPFTLMPESPFYLVSVGKEEEAMKVLSWLWNQDNNLSDEVVKIQKILSMNQTNDFTTRKMDLLRKKGYRRAVFTILFILCAQQLTAIDLVEGYFQTLLADAGFMFPLARATVTLAAIYAITSCAAPPLVRYFGTKTVLITTIFIDAICLGIYGVYMLMKRLDYDLTSYYLIPLLTFAIYFTAFAIGAGPLPWSIMAELSPAEHRSLVTSTCSSIHWLICFLLLRTFYPSIQMFGMDSVFIFYSLSLFVSGIIIVFILPDTKTMSLLEVKHTLLDDKTDNDIEKKVDLNKVTNDQLKQEEM